MVQGIQIRAVYFSVAMISCCSCCVYHLGFGCCFGSYHNISSHILICRDTNVHLVF